MIKELERLSARLAEFTREERLNIKRELEYQLILGIGVRKAKAIRGVLARLKGV